MQNNKSRLTHSQGFFFLPDPAAIQRYIQQPLPLLPALNTFTKVPYMPEYMCHKKIRNGEKWKDEIEVEKVSSVQNIISLMLHAVMDDPFFASTLYSLQPYSIYSYRSQYLPVQKLRRKKVDAKTSGPTFCYFFFFLPSRSRE